MNITSKRVWYTIEHLLTVGNIEIIVEVLVDTDVLLNDIHIELSDIKKPKYVINNERHVINDFKLFKDEQHRYGVDYDKMIEKEFESVFNEDIISKLLRTK
jgi:hypothetical protein